MTSMALLPEILEQVRERQDRGSSSSPKKVGDRAKNSAVALLSDSPTGRALRSTCKVVRAHISLKDLLRAEAKWRLYEGDEHKLLRWATRRWRGDILRWCMTDNIYKRNRNFFRNRAPQLLKMAVGRKDLKTVKVCLDVGADVNMNEGEVLRAAAQTGNVALVTLLLDRGAKVNAKGQDGTALGVAAKWGHTEVVRLLVHRGADPDATGRKEWRSPLYQAPGRQHVVMVRCFVEAGAELDEQGHYAFYDAVEAGHVAVVETLVKCGVDVRSGGWLSFAIEEGQLSLVPILLDLGADVAWDKGEPVFLAASAGHTGTVRALLEKAPAKQDGNSYEEFMVGVNKGLEAASGDGHFDIVKLLVEAGGNQNKVVCKAMQ
ncbi:hypothetical protein HDV00_001517 [Rhizophlyctis rosea]|nr:hypothetical protein HDV00_001517 [Rhizophlyctis rosea]